MGGIIAVLVCHVRPQTVYAFCLLVCLLAATPICAQQDAEPTHPLAKISKAWEGEGFSVGWIQKTEDDLRYFRPSSDLPTGLVPAFSVDREDIRLDSLSRLPSPTKPFGIDLRSREWPADTLKHLARFEKLHALSIYNWANSKDGMRRLSALSQIQSLSITFVEPAPFGYRLTRATKTALEELAKMKSLNTLVIHADTIEGIEQLARMKQLRTLVISRGEVPTGVAILKNLTSLSLSLVAPLKDEHLREIGELTGLTELWLCDAGIADSQTKYLEHLRKLEFLSLEDNKLTELGLKDFGRLPSLRRLHLGNNKISDAGLEYLVKCKRLVDLNLESNDITDAGMKHLERIGTLEQLSVYSTRVTKQGETKLQKALPKVKFYQSARAKAA